jgi:hypothetical protein
MGLALAIAVVAFLLNALGPLVVAFERRDIRG